MIDDSEIDVKWWRKREARNKNVEEEGFVYNNKKKGKIDWYEEPDFTRIGLGMDRERGKKKIGRISLPTHHRDPRDLTKLRA